MDFSCHAFSGCLFCKKRVILLYKTCKAKKKGTFHMKITGIIAEYNPFHNGHLYQIRKIREETDTDFIIVAMSGDFVQRGMPAIVDKYTRAKMALACGADLVVELPVIWATASAEYFATAGVRLFEQTGCVDRLCFGAETSDIALLNRISNCLTWEPDFYRDVLNAQLKSGKNFPSARAAALTEFLGDADGTLSAVLSSPNNILAIEYLKALASGTGNISPYPIVREGNRYHSKSISGIHPSATAIRSLVAGKAASLSALQSEQLSNAMPAPALSVFSEALSAGKITDADDFSSILRYLLLSRSVEELAATPDCNPDIARRLKGNLFSFTDFTQFTALNQTKDTTGTRISRIFTHQLLGISDTDYTVAKESGIVPYIRPLGFRKSSSAVLSQIKKQASVPLIGKLADARQKLSASAFSVLEKDIFAADLYEQVLSQKTHVAARNEYTREMVLLP